MSINPISFKQGYNLWSEQYDSFENPLIAMADLALQGAQLELNIKDVLDLGCGTGRNCSFALQQGARSVTGIDGSKGMLSVAANRLKEEVEKVTLIEVDLTHPWQLESESFDVVIISLVLEHLQDLFAIFEQCNKVLRRGGKIFIAELHAELLEHGTGAHFQHEGETYSLTSFPHSEADYRSSLVGAGFFMSTCTSFYASDSHIKLVPKLARHKGKPVLISILGEKP